MKNIPENAADNPGENQPACDRSDRVHLLLLKEKRIRSGNNMRRKEALIEAK